MLLIWVVMVLRTFVKQSFLTFTPILYAREGHSLISIGLVISLFTMAGAVSGLFAGHLSDRIGYKPIFYVTFVLATPALFLMLLLGQWVYPLRRAGGKPDVATLPLGLVMAQKLAPRGKSMVSSLMMGLARGWGDDGAAWSAAWPISSPSGRSSSVWPGSPCSASVSSGSSRRNVSGGRSLG